MKNYTKHIVVILVIAVIIIVVVFFTKKAPPTNVAEPLPTVTPPTSVEEKKPKDESKNAIVDLIEVDSPESNEVVKSPLKITGQARGTWFFEASFPVSLEGEAGNVIAQGNAKAKGDWMTENFVPFEAILTFSPQVSKTGFLVLQKSNPSGLPENEKELKVPVRFE